MTQHNDDDQRMVRLQEGEGCAFEEIVAASKTHEHMLRIQKALEARHSEALKRRSELTGDSRIIQFESETAMHAVA